jgi:sterol desaturase/sphingolipid hydroxylase (fatty acid hydroxylase superfamily)
MVTTIEILCGLAFALFAGTFGEYVAHRIMHAQFVWGKAHANHHRNGPGPGTGQVWLGEFKEYSISLVPVLGVLLPIAWLLGLPAACIGIAAGGVVWVAISAYCHQAQHDRPELIFWMKMPSHHIHHVYHQWHHNFGVTVDWWDHVFGTYKEMPWDRPPDPVRWRDLLDIEWRKPKSKGTQQRVQNTPDSQVS